jgi:hypothetical protein
MMFSIKKYGFIAMHDAGTKVNAKLEIKCMY